MGAREKVQKLAKMAAVFSKVVESEKGLVRIVSHYDADGITSGAIIYKLMQLLNKDFEIVFLKQLDSGSLDTLSIEKEPAGLWIFTDMGSGHLRIIKNHLEHDKVLVIDHHQPENLQWPNLYHFNPYLAGIRGEDEISSSGMAYIIARAMAFRARALVPIALVGAVGDMQKKSGEFKGINSLLLEDAVHQGLVKVENGLRIFGRYTKPVHKALEYNADYPIPGLSGSESASVQFLSNLGIKLKKSDGSWKTLADLSENEEKKLAESLMLEGAPKGIIGQLYKMSNGWEIGEFASILNACGKIGKPLEGLKFCLGKQIDVHEILLQYRHELGKAVQWYIVNKDTFMATKNATYIIAKGQVLDSQVGTILTTALKSGNIKTQAAFAFANASDGVKVSARLKDNSNFANLGEVIAKATAHMREQGMKAEGGGHRAAAGAKIPFNSEEQFIGLIEKQLEK